MMGSFFPNSQSSTVTPRVPRHDSQQSGGPTRRILLVDDEESILSLARVILERQGHRVHTASTPEEAVHLCREAMLCQNPFDCAIIDYEMNCEYTGVDILRSLRRQDSELRAALSTGDPGHPVSQNFQTHGFDAVMLKPYSPKELIALLDSLPEVADNTHTPRTTPTKKIDA